MSSSQNIEHYGGPADNLPTLATALPPEQGQTTQSCPELFCMYHKSDGNICWQLITCQTLSTHMQSEHGVYEKPKDQSDQYAYCQWNHCWKRIGWHNIYRHLRECHLRHKRGVGHWWAPQSFYLSIRLSSLTSETSTL
ncbi:hypothetical protein PISMIDRAFT_238747 [Pisolithus microcarpus 441]|uniref:Uncharacterized protein n=1 Tax=Pisolithus microcarpus 441 TaxID=765257 RepID=A0A0C9YK82_9AGAM|nr:hypothetical protein PISMIDRAFT_238747 [Pisolithus microcarpus 441]